MIDIYQNVPKNEIESYIDKTEKHIKELEKQAIENAHESYIKNKDEYLYHGVSRKLFI